MVHPVLQYKNITENRTGKFDKKKMSDLKVGKLPETFGRKAKQ